MIGLDGRLISKVADKIDTQLFTKIYEKMIYTEEVDNILLMSKGQGASTLIQGKSRSI